MDNLIELRNYHTEEVIRINQSDIYAASYGHRFPLTVFITLKELDNEDAGVQPRYYRTFNNQDLALAWYTELMDSIRL